MNRLPAILTLLIVTLVSTAFFSPDCIAQEPKKPSFFKSLFASSLERALQRGMAAGGDLGEELGELDDYTVSSESDAKAIVDVLKQMPRNDDDLEGYSSSLYSVVRLLQDVDGRDCDAYLALEKEATPELVRIFGKLQDSEADVESDGMMILKILALYYTRDGAKTVVEAARKGFASDAYMWSIIMEVVVDEDHPQREFILERLVDPLPTGFIAISLLDAANSSALDGLLERHPFDTPQGKARLRMYLTSDDSEKYSYAHSAAAALPFVHGAERDELLAIARDHADMSVKMEGAWASAKIEMPIGLDLLAEYAKMPNHSTTACEYLEELEREDRIPAEAKEPEFQAKAEFAQWLAHPNELAEPPDELEVVDTRNIYWPPNDEQLTLWVIKYVLHDDFGLEADDVDCGLVGSGTWCFFYRDMYQRPPEDVLAIHCAWEMDIQSEDVSSPTKYEAMLSEWPHEPLTEAEVVQVIRVPIRQKLGRGRMYLATAKLNGKPGWAVIDGEHSRWYPADEFPEGELPSIVLNVHVGRRLLGFGDQPDRKEYLKRVPAEPSDQQIVDAYEKVLAELGTANLSRKLTLLDSWRGPIGDHMLRYTQACQAVGRESKSQAIVRVFEQVLDVVRELPPDSQEDCYHLGGPIGAGFDAYLSAVVELGHTERIMPLVEHLKPHWDHPAGHSMLGTAAYKAGDLAEAEPLLVKARESFGRWEFSDSTESLARLWHQQGKQEQARDLLLECLEKLSTDATEASDSDEREEYEKSYQAKRTALGVLFPDADELLKQKGLPESTLGNDE